jgi:hypothetical protein
MAFWGQDPLEMATVNARARGYFVLHAVYFACRFGVNSIFILFFWANSNFILLYFSE